MKPANGRCLIFCIFVFAAFTLSAAQGPIKPSSGKALCNALTPADFSKAGVPVSALSQANTDGNDGAYCVYKSSAGKVEFDIFYPAGANAAEVLATEKTVLGEGGSKYTPLKLAGADRAQISLAMPDLPQSAGIVVRKGNAVFDIVVPRGTKAREQLVTLAQVVLGRIR
ncbi:MAG TPA: hypothetical protein VE783_09095 [Candidatus Limnocylindrales bacterium]|nr:hypothetical protein [Candidatus Limnocylindrales bacterium]